MHKEKPAFFKNTGYSVDIHPQSLDDWITKIHHPDMLPNPFTGEAKIRYKVARAGQVKVDVFVDNGRLIKTLVDAEHAVGGFGVK